MASRRLASLEEAFVRPETGLRGPIDEVQNAKAAFDRMVALREADLVPRGTTCRSAVVLDADRLLSEYRQINANKVRLEVEARSAAEGLGKLEDANRNATRYAGDLMDLLLEHRTVLGEERVDRLSERADAFRVELTATVNALNGHLAAAKSSKDADLAATLEDERTLHALIAKGTERLREDGPNAKLNDDAHTCPICFDRESTVVFTPCGHAACEPCSERIMGRAVPGTPARQQQQQQQQQQQPVGTDEASPSLLVLGSADDGVALITGSPISTVINNSGGSGGIRSISGTPDKRCPKCRTTVGATVRIYW
jgi:hypothetical protein